MEIAIGILVVIFIIYKLFIKPLYDPRCASSQCGGARMFKHAKSIYGTQYMCPKCGAKTGWLKGR